jgi:hypothetical protein
MLHKKRATNKSLFKIYDSTIYYFIVVGQTKSVVGMFVFFIAP